MQKEKSISQNLSRLFLAALIANTVLLVILLTLGGSIRQSDIRRLNDMGVLTLQTFKGLRPIVWSDPQMLQRFLNQITDQSAVINIFVYDKDRNIMFAYNEPDPAMMHYPAPNQSILTKDSMFVYADGSGMLSDWGSHGGGGWHGMGGMRVGMGMGRYNNTGFEGQVLAIQLDASDVVATIQLRNISFFIALLIEIVLLLFYKRLRKVIRDYADSQKSLQIAQQEAATGRLASILAHEIKNPLSSIKGLVSFAAKKTDNEQIADNLNRSIGEVDRLTAILNGFLSFGKPVELERTEFSLREMCEKAASLLYHDSTKANKLVELTDGDIKLNADYNQLLQVLMNLILNALDASPANGTVKIAIDSSARELCIINDVASGVAVDAERIFEPFYTTKTHGSGLGLAIARKIIEIHGYKIDLPQTAPFTIRIRF
ncbi:MAG: hypothetical protein LBV04_06325 [Deferribacteraceae bacterium]|jgi:two-component system sensor histidine kinase HydH|nr:hypothetical protein [Deferribacteraceae bacterium]